MGQAEAPHAEIDDARLCTEPLRQHGAIFLAVVDPDAEGKRIAENNDVRSVVAARDFGH